MRLLVVDGSRLMAYLVASLAPDDVEVEHVQTFAAALKALTGRPPDAAILNLTPADLPWKDLVKACRETRPPIPLRCCTTVYGGEQLVQTGAAEPCQQVLEKPLALGVLRELVAELLAEAAVAPRPDPAASSP